MLGVVAIVVLGGMAAGDRASGHSCTKLETAVTVLGDPTCVPHDPETHDCRVIPVKVGTLTICVEVSSGAAPGWGRRAAGGG